MKLKHIYKEFNKNGEIIKVLDDINYDFQNNKMYAILGQSGSGKTTLINILGLLENPTSGTYIFNKIDTSTIGKDKILELRNKNIGYVFQNVELNDYLTARENVELPMLINKEIKPNERKQKSDNLLNKFGLKERVTHFPKELSGGERQRVCIARALANNPKVILCDEPTSSLDKSNTKKVFSLLKEISSEGYCVIIVSHDENIFNYADICLELKDGHLYEVSK